MIRKMHTDEFDRIFSIMENSFPSDEYRTYEEQKKLLLNKKYDIYTFIIKERIQGFISVWKFDNFLYIEHLAVDADCRNHGAGAKLLDEMKNLFPGRICLEVELPVPARTADAKLSTTSGHASRSSRARTVRSRRTAAPGAR